MNMEALGFYGTGSSSRNSSFPRGNEHQDVEPTYANETTRGPPPLLLQKMDLLLSKVQAQEKLVLDLKTQTVTLASEVQGLRGEFRELKEKSGEDSRPRGSKAKLPTQLSVSQYIASWYNKYVCIDNKANSTDTHTKP